MEKEVIAKTPATNLEKIKEFGKIRTLEDKWTNMLIFGDCLMVLKTLMANPDIKEKVKLIYIDPLFSTNHEFKLGKSRTATISASEEDETAYVDRLRGADYFEFL